eukprot:5673249-Alexandrium_andersonii.AAC.1
MVAAEAELPKGCRKRARGVPARRWSGSSSCARTALWLRGWRRWRRPVLRGAGCAVRWRPSEVQ